MKIILSILLAALLSGCSHVYDRSYLVTRAETPDSVTLIYEELNSKTGEWRLVCYRYQKGKAEPIVAELGRNRP